MAQIFGELKLIERKLNDFMGTLTYAGEHCVGSDGKLLNCPDGDEDSFMYCCVSGPRAYCCGLDERVRGVNNSR
jgi:hypothetical protein